jgi:5-methyltetrahydrofolate--homocysteine methyltransferase
MDTVIDPTARPELVEKTVRTAAGDGEARPATRSASPGRDLRGRPVGGRAPVAEPPHAPSGASAARPTSTLAELWPHLDLKTLFRLHWGGKGVKDEAWERLQAEEFLPRLQRMQAEAEATGWLAPAVRYGYWPANADGNDLVIFDPVDRDRELLRFDFPRQTAREHLCLADYFLSIESGTRDVVSFQVVTMGSAADERSAALQAAGEYSESYFTHGLSVQSAEGMAELIHQRVRRELGIGEETGKRYSWGYPELPGPEPPPPRRHPARPRARSASS